MATVTQITVFGHFVVIADQLVRAAGGRQQNMTGQFGMRSGRLVPRRAAVTAPAGPGAAEGRAKAASRSSTSSARWPYPWVCAASSGSANVCARAPARSISSTRRPLRARKTAVRTLVRS